MSEKVIELDVDGSFLVDENTVSEYGHSLIVNFGDKCTIRIKDIGVTDPPIDDIDKISSSFGVCSTRFPYRGYFVSKDKTKVWSFLVEVLRHVGEDKKIKRFSDKKKKN